MLFDVGLYVSYVYFVYDIIIIIIIIIIIYLQRYFDWNLFCVYLVNRITISKLDGHSTWTSHTGKYSFYVLVWVVWCTLYEHRNHGSRHHSSIALTSYAYVTLWSTQWWSKMNSGVNKWISKGRKTNPNLSVLFNVRILELRLTSLIGSAIFAGFTTVTGRLTDKQTDRQTTLLGL